MSARWLVPLIVVAPLLVQSPASALSCVPFADQEPHSSFAGTIVQKRGDAYLFAVREVWSGPNLTDRSWVRFDELWPDPVPAVGQAWVVFADESYRANTCTATPAGDDADDLRPAKVRKPTPATWWSAIRTSLMATVLLVPAPAVVETG